MHCCLWFRSVFRVRGPWPKCYGYHLSIIIITLQKKINKYKKTFKNEQRNRDDTAKKRVNTSGVGESNNYYRISIIYIPPYNNTH